MTAYFQVAPVIYSEVDLAMSDVKRAVRDGPAESTNWGKLALYDYTGAHFYNSEFSRCLLSLPMLSQAEFRRVVGVVFKDFDLNIEGLWGDGASAVATKNYALADHVPYELRYQLGSVFLHSNVSRLSREPEEPGYQFEEAVRAVLARDRDRAFAKDQRLHPRIDVLSRKVRQLFPCEPFCSYGAQTSGFATSFSDYDYTVGSRAHRQRDSTRAIDELAHALKDVPGIASIECRTNANVPLCRCILTHDDGKDYENTVEISFDNNIALHNSKWLYLYSTYDRRARELGKKNSTVFTQAFWLNFSFGRTPSSAPRTATTRTTPG